MSGRVHIASALRRLAVTVILGWAIAGMSAGVYAQAEKPRGKPTLRETTIEEADLSGGGSRDAVTGASQPEGDSKRDRRRGDANDLRDEKPEEAAEDLAPAEGQAGGLPLMAKVTAKTTPQRAASLRLIDEGRKFLEAGEYKQALAGFERAIAVDATNPYSHYFVARAHFFLGNYAESLNFLDVAESLLVWHKRWLAEIYVLKGRNAAALGFLGRADTDYLEALASDPYNRFAIERLTTIDQIVEGPAPAP